MTKPLKKELLAWLEKMKQDEQNAPEKYSTCGQLFRLPDGLPIAPDVLTKWYRMWRAEHPEFEKIVFHGLRHSSATYQLLQSGGDFKSVQGNTGHATATVLMDTYEAALKTLDSIPPEVIRFYENRSTQEPAMRHDK